MGRDDTRGEADERQGDGGLCRDGDWHGQGYRPDDRLPGRDWGTG